MRILLLLFLLFSSSYALADTWFFESKLKKDVFSFGELAIERIIDTRSDNQYPDYRVKVFKQGQEIANYKNLTFDQIQTFDRGNFLFAGSNSGLSNFAFFILSKDGGLVVTKIHSMSISYCEFSVTVRREWLPEGIEIVETYESFYYGDETKKHFTGAKVKNCKGNFVELFE